MTHASPTFLHARGGAATPAAANRPALVVLLAPVVLLLAACGGSGGGAADEAPPTTPFAACLAPGATHATLVKAPVTVGQSAGAAVAGCAGALDAPQWTQTGGPAVPLLAAKSQAISFDPPAAGRYAFRVEFRDATGAAHSDNVAVDVAAAPVGGPPGAPSGAPSEAQLALRMSHAVRAGGNVSVRAWPQPLPGDGVRSISWQQFEGPAVTLDTRDDHVALFVAPNVSRDTVIRLRATLTTNFGHTASDEVLVLVEAHTQAAAGDSTALWRDEHVSRVFPFNPNGPYAGVLARCVYDSGLRTTNLCPLSQLPLLAQSTGGGVPTVEQVMDRVVVSHEWAGRNFETFLRQHDTAGHFRRMLNSATAVVIGAQVRPSFYYAVTGAIYLDADNFWLTPEERDTVNEAPDYRSGFGNTLQYTSLWRYVRGSTSLFQFYDPRPRVVRDTGALRDEAGWLLLHELAHALDFVPPAAYASLDGAASPWGNIAPRYGARQLASDTVPTRHPLASAELAALGRVRFLGATATAAQEAYTPGQVAGFFGPDLATDDYAYASPREDVAMALEEFLMQRWLGVQRDFAIAPRPGSGDTGSSLPVTWGQRGRIGEPALRPRLRAIVQQLVPWVDAAEVDLLPAPLAMRSGDSWTGNLVLSGPPAPRTDAQKAGPTLRELWLIEQAERRRGRLQPASPPPALSLRPAVR